MNTTPPLTTNTDTNTNTTTPLTTTSPDTAPTANRSNTFALVLTIVVIEFVSGFTQGFYEPLIPKFGETLGVDASGLTLFNIIPTAVAALFVPVLTRLGDIKGYRVVLRAVISMVFVATLIIWAGVAAGSWSLVLLGRLLNGPIAVWLPLHIALVHAKTNGKQATSAVSAIIATLTVGTVAGTASSGFIFRAFGALAQTVPVVPALIAVAVLLVFIVMPEFVSGADPYIDIKGFALLGLVMFLTIIGFVEVVEGGVNSGIGAVALVAAGLVAAVWYRYEKHTEHPAIDVRVLFSRELGPLYLSAIAYGAVFYGFLAPLATFLSNDDYGYGYQPEAISIAQTLTLVATVIAALLLPVMIGKLGAKLGLISGFVAAVIGFVLWTELTNSILKLGLFIVLVGLGFGVIGAAIPVIIPQRAPIGTHGIATGLFNSAQTLGGALGGGLFLSLLRVGATESGEITAKGYDVVWLTSAGILALGLLVVVRLLSRERRSTEQNVKNNVDSERIEL
ncbi:MAG: MFS transporter [Propionibacteriaceae bacterium]|jgi:MFS family permease|nr:MFS transporter [Propionibacteriaceae bacterium]